MPTETQAAVTWALGQQQTNAFGNKTPIEKTDKTALVDKVREYFNTNNVQYSTFSYDDLKSFL